jgi:small-conductance mechanosensitive channel
MNIKQTVLTLALLFGIVALFAAPAAQAATCGGVETSIISCSQGGSCGGGENPFEGTDPKGVSKEKTAYFKQYGHNYGFCKKDASGNDVTPSDTVESTGVWGVLLLAINILTGGVTIAAIAGVVYGSVLYTSAGGSTEQTKKAMGVITNVVIGVIAYALMYAFLNFIIPGGLFTS